MKNLLNEGQKPTEEMKPEKARSNHGNEVVTRAVLRLLGKSYKVNRKVNTRQVSQEKKDQADKMRKSHMEQERDGTKWRPGMREERHEQRQERTSKTRQGRRRTETEKQTENSTTFSVSSNNQSATFSESHQDRNPNNQLATFSESHQNTNSHSERSKIGEKPNVGSNSTYFGIPYVFSYP